jgi:ABC-type transport system involved in cytochrome c biogenesis ATPase subunit
LPAGDRGLHFRLTGRQNLEFFAKVCRVPASDIDGAVEAAAEAVGAQELLNKRVGNGSTGQRRRFAIAQAVVGRSPVLLLDEPFADLDDDGVALVQTVTDRWRNGGGVVVAAAPEHRQAPAGSRVIDIRSAGAA